jgi:hypothetical protein
MLIAQRPPRHPLIWGVRRFAAALGRIDGTGATPQATLSTPRKLQDDYFAARRTKR